MSRSRADWCGYFLKHHPVRPRSWQAPLSRRKRTGPSVSAESSLNRLYARWRGRDKDAAREGVDGDRRCAGIPSYPSPSRWRGEKITDERRVIATRRPIGVRANGDINAVWMNGIAGEHVVDVVAPVHAMVEVKGCLRLLAMCAPALTMVQAMKSVLLKQGDEVAKLVPP